MRPAAYRINLTAHEVRQLEQMIRKSTAPQHLVKRAKIILMANEEGKSNKEIAARVGTTLGKVTKWTRRWIEKALDPVKERLSDLPRCGSPVKGGTVVSNHSGMLQSTQGIWLSDESLDGSGVSQRSHQTRHCRKYFGQPPQ